MIPYGFLKTLDLPFGDAEKKVTEELKKEGFGVLSRIDLSEKFKEKLGVYFKQYVILGACNPPFALKTLEAEENIGLFLPCNVILYDTDGGTAVGIVRPSAAMGGIDNDALVDISAAVEEKLKNVFDAL